MEYNELYQALLTMVSRSNDVHGMPLDGRKDEVGLNQPDAKFGRELLPKHAYWTPKQALAVYNMLGKYAKTQLAGVYENIPKPEIPTKPQTENKTEERNQAVSTPINVKENLFYVSLEWGCLNFDFKKRALKDAGWKFNEPSTPKNAWSTALARKVQDAMDACKYLSLSEDAKSLMETKKELIAMEKARVEESVKAGKAEKPQDESRFTGALAGLYPYQKAGVERAVALGGRALIADEMGLGKTAQAIATCELMATKSVLVVVPASLKENWRREIAKWAGKEAHIIKNGKDALPLPLPNYAIISYDSMRNRVDELEALDFQSIILDEAHKIKGNTQQAKAALRLTKKAAHALLLTGTPIMNRPVELVNQLLAIGCLDKISKNISTFKNYFCKGNGERTFRGHSDYKGASHMVELKEKLYQTCMIRRMKADVLKDLPSTRRMIVPCEINNRKVYETVLADFLSWLAVEKDKDASARASKAEAICKINALKKVVLTGITTGKDNPVNAWLDECKEAGKPVAVFACHNDILKALAEQYNCPLIIGETPQAQRQQNVDDFNAGKHPFIFLNVQAGGVGLNLQENASTTAFLELGWTPGEHDQAEARVNRIGQKSDTVEAYYFLAQNTVAQDIYDLIEKKRQVIAGGVGISEDIVTEFLNVIGGSKKEPPAATTPAITPDKFDAVFDIIADGFRLEIWKLEKEIAFLRGEEFAQEQPTISDINVPTGCTNEEFETIFSLASEEFKTAITELEGIVEGLRNKKEDVPQEYISAYSSNQAVEDGMLVDLKETGFGGPINLATTNLLVQGEYIRENESGESKINMPCLADLVLQGRLIIEREIKKGSTFASGKIELPNGSKQEVFIAGNETGGYTIMLPEDY